MSDGTANGQAAEEQLGELLALLRAESSPALDESAIESIMRTARWQYALRGVLHITGLLAAAVGDGFGVLLGAPTQAGEDTREETGE